MPHAGGIISGGSVGGRSDLFSNAANAVVAGHGVTNGFVDYGVFGDLQEKNQLAQEIAAQRQRDFEQSSAREAMAFEADQAAINRDFQLSSAREAMAFEADQAAINRDWQEQMSNTAYQRVVKDLQAAGLNPALAYQQGGAATTSGATAAGHAAGGSAASGYKSSGSKADVDDSTAKDLMTAFINAAVSLTGIVSNYSVGMAKAAADLIPG